MLPKSFTLVFSPVESPVCAVFNGKFDVDDCSSLCNQLSPKNRIVRQDLKWDPQGATSRGRPLKSVVEKNG